MKEKPTSKPRKCKSVPKYKKQILYEFRLTEAWFPIQDLLAIKENFL
jgi:hypothetical protein